MIRIRYETPELKDLATKIVQRNFYLYANEMITRAMVELGSTNRPTSSITVLVASKGKKLMGKVAKKGSLSTITVGLNESPKEIAITLFHETIHLLKPDWTEAQVEEKAQEINASTEPGGMSL